jgi:ribosomal protein S18 acetylase RimI-like enzyme
METIKIRKTRKHEFSIIQEFISADGYASLKEFCHWHYNSDYFYPVVATIESEIIGTGIDVINDNAAWLGFINVRENHRNKGIGKMITNHLINYSKTRGIDKIILTATDLGLRIYQKIGFKHDLYYLFFKADNPTKNAYSGSNVSEIEKNDYSQIIKLDYAISGEKREKLLAHYMKSGFKYKERKIKGYYLPDFGRGLIIADSEKAGLDLLKFRLSRDTSPLSVPETNEAAINFFKSLGFCQFLEVPRMFLNKNVVWDSKNIYSRGCGYLG